MIDRDEMTPGGVGSCPRHRHMDGRTGAAAGPAWAIRTIEPGDRADAKRLFLKLHIYNARLDPRFALSADWERPFDAGLDRVLTGRAGVGLLARAGVSGRAIGLALAAMHRDGPLWAVRDWLELEDVYVEPAWRGTGLAVALVARVDDGARATGVDTIQLYVTASNARALAFYDKEGFRPAQFILRKHVAVPHQTQQRAAADAVLKEQGS